MNADADRIARGGQPTPWEQTFEHPTLGPLTFKAGLPKALALAQHSVRIDNLLEDLVGEPRGATMMLVAAIAGIAHDDHLDAPGHSCLLELPVIREEREADEARGSERIVKHFYDAADEADTVFLVEVWTAFSVWRHGVLQEVDAVKGPSGVTDGSDSKQSSAAPTASHSTTPA